MWETDTLVKKVKHLHVIYMVSTDKTSVDTNLFRLSITNFISVDGKPCANFLTNKHSVAL